MQTRTLVQMSLTFAAILAAPMPALAAAPGMPSECQTFCSTKGGKSHPLCTAATQPGGPSPVATTNGRLDQSAESPQVARVRAMHNSGMNMDEILSQLGWHMNDDVAAIFMQAGVVNAAGGIIAPPRKAGGVVLGDHGAVTTAGVPQECTTFCSTKGGAGHSLCQSVLAVTNSTGGSSGGLMVNHTYGKSTAGAVNADAVAARLSKEQQAEAKSLGRHVKSVERGTAERARLTAEQYVRDASGRIIGRTRAATP